MEPVSTPKVHLLVWTAAGICGSGVLMNGAAVSCEMLPEVIVVAPLAIVIANRPDHPASAVGFVCDPVAAAMPALIWTAATPLRTVFCAVPALPGPENGSEGLAEL